jgi:hypothetical protein
MGGAIEFENRYGRERWRSNSTTPAARISASSRARSSLTESNTRAAYCSASRSSNSSVEK